MEPQHESLYALLESGKKNRKKVVVLGSGLVAGPAVRLIASRKDVDLVIGESLPLPFRTQTDPFCSE